MYIRSKKDVGAGLHFLKPVGWGTGGWGAFGGSIERVGVGCGWINESGVFMGSLNGILLTAELFGALIWATRFYQNRTPMVARGGGVLTGMGSAFGTIGLGGAGVGGIATGREGRGLPWQPLEQLGEQEVRIIWKILIQREKFLFVFVITFY